MSILFCTPAYGGQVFAPHMQSCIALTRDLTAMDMSFEWLVRWNESLVHRARMGMTSEFLTNTDYGYMMWLDADIEFSSDDVGKLWNLDADIAVGVYRMKSDNSKFAAWVDGKLVTDLDQFNEPIEVDYAGTGFMLIKREVVEELAKVVPHFTNERKNIPALYQTPIHNGILESEDYHFCRIARENGFKVMMDPTIKLKHWGIKSYG